MLVPVDSNGKYVRNANYDRTYKSIYLDTKQDMRKLAEIESL